MLISTAIELVSQLVYKPGWNFAAEDHTRRFEGSILLRIDYHAYASERKEAPEYLREIDTYATFPLVVRDCDAIDLYRAVLACILEIEEHEAREFLRIEPTMWAPFHPHNIDGMKRWQTHRIMAPKLIDDLKFGIA